MVSTKRGSSSRLILVHRIHHLFKPRPGTSHPENSFYRSLYPRIIQDIQVNHKMLLYGFVICVLYDHVLTGILLFSQNIENNWLKGDPNLQLINCRSENSKGVYCLQYDDSKIVSGLRDNTIKIWDRQTLQCTKVSMKLEI